MTTLKNTLNLEVGTAVVVEKEGRYLVETVTKETPKCWVIGKARFNKEGKDKYGLKDLECNNKNDVLGYRGNYKNYKIVGRADDASMMSKVEASQKKHDEKVANEKAERAARDAKEQAEKEWRQTDEGLAQTARDNDWEGLTVVIEKNEQASSGRRARISLVGDYYSNHEAFAAGNVVKMYEYTKLEVTQDTDWGYEGEGDERAFVTRLKQPTIDTYSLRGSARKASNFIKMLNVAQDLYEAWDKATGREVSRSK